MISAGQFQQLRAGLGRSGSRRHPAEVTADRLGQAVTQWADKFDAEERDWIGTIIYRLQKIADGVE